MDINGCYLPRPTDSHLESLALAQGTQGHGIGCLPWQRLMYKNSPKVMSQTSGFPQIFPSSFQLMFQRSPGKCTKKPPDFSVWIESPSHWCFFGINKGVFVFPASLTFMPASSSASESASALQLWDADHPAAAIRFNSNNSMSLSFPK